jgi:hypothetical protein
MATKVSLLLLISLYFSISNACAQAQAGRNVDDHLLIKESKKPLHDTEVTVEGSPYLNDSFISGEVHFEKGPPSAVPVRYNIYRDYMEYEQQGKVYVLDPSSRIKKVTINELVFLVEKYENKGKGTFGYFTLLDSGKVSLFTKQVVIFHEQKEPKALESGVTPAKYARAANAFYFKTHNGIITKIDNLKKFVSGLPDKQNEVMQFAKAEKLSTRKEDELKKLIQFYNSL